MSACARSVYRVYFVHQVVPRRRLKQFAINFPRAEGNGARRGTESTVRNQDTGWIRSRDSGKSPSVVSRFHFLSLHLRCAYSRCELPRYFAFVILLNAPSGISSLTPLTTSGAKFIFHTAIMIFSPVERSWDNFKAPITKILGKLCEECC